MKRPSFLKHMRPHLISALICGAVVYAGWWVHPQTGADLDHYVRAAILHHDRDVLRAELDDARHEVESAHVALQLLCQQPAAVADDDPPIPSFKTDCAIVWSKLLDATSGQVKLQRFGAARVVSWWPDYPGKFHGKKSPCDKRVQSVIDSVGRLLGPKNNAWPAATRKRVRRTLEMVGGLRKVKP